MRYSSKGDNTSDIADIYTHMNSSHKVLEDRGRGNIAACELRDTLDPVVKTLSCVGLALALKQRDNSQTMRLWEQKQPSGRATHRSRIWPDG